MSGKLSDVPPFKIDMGDYVVEFHVERAIEIYNDLLQYVLDLEKQGVCSLVDLEEESEYMQ